MLQIEQMTRVIARAIADLVGIKTTVESNYAIQQTRETLIEELDLDICQLVQKDEAVFLQELSKNEAMADQALAELANLLFEMGTVENDAQMKQKYFEKALFLYKHLTQNTGLYSLDWIAKTDAINQYLKEFN